MEISRLSCVCDQTHITLSLTPLVQHNSSIAWPDYVISVHALCSSEEPASISLMSVITVRERSNGPQLQRAMTVHSLASPCSKNAPDSLVSALLDEREKLSCLWWSSIKYVILSLLSAGCVKLNKAEVSLYVGWEWELIRLRGSEFSKLLESVLEN